MLLRIANRCSGRTGRGPYTSLTTSQVCTRGLRCGSRQWRQRELHTFHGNACGVLLRLTCSTRRRHHTKCIRRKRRRISVSLHLNFNTSCPFHMEGVPPFLLKARLWILTDHCLGHCIIQLAQLELQVVLMRVVQRHM